MIDAAILVVGGGAIGGITAAKLAPALRRVTVLDAHAAHAAALRDPGLVYEEAGAEHRVHLDAVTSPDELEDDYDFALVAIKAPVHAAVTLGTIGVAIVIAARGTRFEASTLRGDLLSVAALLFWALFTVGVRRHASHLSLAVKFVQHSRRDEHNAHAEQPALVR